MRDAYRYTIFREYRPYQIPVFSHTFRALKAINVGL